MAVTSRYIQLVEALPSGKFYEADGHVLPFRSTPYEFRLETSNPTRTYGVYLNGQFLNTVLTDNLGIALVVISLPQGRCDIELLDSVTGGSLHAYVEIRKSATWHAAYADVIEASDQKIEDLYDTRQIQTCPALYLEDTYGVPLRVPNTDRYSTRTYRNVLEDLRQSFRHYAGMDRGLRLGVETITSVAPFRLPRSIRPDWILGEDLLPNGNLQQKTKQAPQLYQIAGQDLPSINRRSFSRIVTGVANNASFVTIAHQPPVPQRLTCTILSGVWLTSTFTITGTSPTGQVISETIFPVATGSLTATNGTTVQVFATVTSVVLNNPTVTGAFARIGLADSRCIRVLGIGNYSALASTTLTLTLGTPNTLTWGTGSPVQLWTAGNFTAHDAIHLSALFGRNQSPYNLQPVTVNVSDNTDQLFLTSEGFPTVQINLSAVGGFPTPTAAQVVTAINAQAPVGFPTASTVTGTEGVNGVVLELESISAVIPNSVRLLSGPSDAARQIFGLPAQQATLNSSASLGATSIVISSADAGRFPIPDKTGIQAAFTTPIVGIALGRPSTATNLGYGTLQITVTVTPGFPTTAIAVWTAPGDSAGAGVDIVAGGSFTLLSSNDTFTLPITVDLPAFQQYLSVSQVLGGSNDVEISSDTEFDIRLHGRRFTRADGAVTPLGNPIHATFVSAGGGFVASDVNSYVRIVDGVNAGNQGIHKITAYTSGTTVTLLNADAANATAFVSASSLRFTMWANGEVHRVTARSGTSLTLREGLLATWTNSSATWIEPVNASPVAYVVNDDAASGSITIEYDPTLDPDTTSSNNITPTGGEIPDGWYIGTNVTASTRIFGLLGLSRTILRTNVSSTDVTLFRQVPQGTDYRGFQLRANFGVQECSTSTGSFRIDVSMDGAATWDIGTVQTTDPAGQVYTGRPLISASGRGTLDPQLVTRSFYVTRDASDVWIRLVRPGQMATPLTITVDLVTLEATTHTSLFLGTNTVPRDAAHAPFDDLLYVWSPEILSSTEEGTLGLPQLRTDGSLPSVPTNPGLIDYLSPAHEILERFNVSEYDVNDDPINIIGCYSDSEWLTATLTNMEVAPGTPNRLTYARPTRISTVDQEDLILTSTIGGANSNSLVVQPLYEGAIPNGDPDGNSTLFEITGDGQIIPVGDTPDFNAVQPWNWISGNRIFIDNAYLTAGSTFMFSYPALIRAETPPLVLPSNRAEYLWLIDAAVWAQADPRQVTVTKSVQLTFQANYTAPLTDQSNLDRTQASLVQNNGIRTQTIALSDWSFLDGFTVRLNSSLFDPDALYTLTYQALDLQTDLPVQYRIDYRTAASTVALASAPYITGVANNTPINPIAVDDTTDQYVQVRFTALASSIVDVRTLRIYGLGVKGLHLTTAPGIVLPTS